MTISKAKFDKEYFSNMPRSERNNLVAIAHLQNEIRFSLFGVMWTGDFKSENDAIAKGQISYNFFFIRVLAGKLYEGWKMLTKHHFSDKDLSKDFNVNGCDESRFILKDLKKYFASRNPIMEIRDNLSFHYSPDHLGDRSMTMPEELEIYISKENDANSLYYFAEAAVNWSVLSKLDYSEDSNPLDSLNNEIIGVAKKFNKFNMLYMKYLIRKHSPDIWDGAAEDIEIGGLPSFKDVKIPMFTDTSKGFV